MKYPVRDLITNPTVGKRDTKVEDIIDIMDKKGVDMIPVVSGEETYGRFLGVISRSDILTEKMNERFVTIERNTNSTAHM
ncbi:MAG: CBS domain-containing protein [Nitrososphaeraceae archaeon]